MIPDIYMELYVEPFGGPYSEIFRRHPSKVEAYNDYDLSLVSLFRVLQDPETHERFTTRLSRTLYSQEECREAREILEREADIVEKAWALFVLQNMSMASNFKSTGKWGRSFDVSGSKNPTRTDRLSLWHDRISRAQIDCRKPLEFMRYWDSEDTLTYINAPEGWTDLLLLLDESKSLMGGVVSSHYVEGFISLGGKYLNERAASLIENRKLA